MSTHSNGGSDTGAAFIGLILGSLFIGLVLWGVVVLTNRSFEGHEAEAGAKPVSVSAPSQQVQFA